MQMITLPHCCLYIRYFLKQVSGPNWKYHIEINCQIVKSTFKQIAFKLKKIHEKNGSPADVEEVAMQSAAVFRVAVTFSSSDWVLLKNWIICAPAGTWQPSNFCAFLKSCFISRKLLSTWPSCKNQETYRGHAVLFFLLVFWVAIVVIFALQFMCKLTRMPSLNFRNKDSISLQTQSTHSVMGNDLLSTDNLIIAFIFILHL